MAWARTSTGDLTHGATAARALRFTPSEKLARKNVEFPRGRNYIPERGAAARVRARSANKPVMPERIRPIEQMLELSEEEAASPEHLDSQVQKAQEQLLALKRQQEQIEKQKRE